MLLYAYFKLTILYIFLKRKDLPCLCVRNMFIWKIYSNSTYFLYRDVKWKTILAFFIIKIRVEQKAIIACCFSRSWKLSVNQTWQVQKRYFLHFVPLPISPFLGWWQKSWPVMPASPLAHLRDHRNPHFQKWPLNCNTAIWGGGGGGKGTRGEFLNTKPVEGDGHQKLLVSQELLSTAGEQEPWVSWKKKKWKQPKSAATVQKYEENVYVTLITSP